MGVAKQVDEAQHHVQLEEAIQTHVVGELEHYSHVHHLHYLGELQIH